MVVKRINLKNFRCHKDITIELNPNVTIITGKNGSGKTSILEAIYIVCRGKSFKGSLKDITNSESSWWSIKANIDNDEISSSFKISNNIKEKKFTVNNNKHTNLPTKNKKPVVLFEPDDMRIINGSPTRRREYIDKLITQFDNEYQTVINRYNKALKQRNFLLKKTQTTKKDLFIWNTFLSDYGSRIVNKRIETIDLINNSLTNIYDKLSDSSDEIKIKYSETLTKNTRQKLFNQLENDFLKDVLIKTTTSGPHRHDILFNLNNKEAKTTASRGEIRTIILSLKFFEIKKIEENNKDKCLILLDDVYSELDETRQKKLNDFTINNQVLISTVNLIDKNNKSKIMIHL